MRKRFFNLWLKTGLAGIYLLFFTACSLLKPVEFRSIDHWSVNSVNHKTRLSARLTVYNPNGFKLKITHYDASVFIKDTYLGKLKLDTLPVLPSHEEYTSTVHLDIGLGSLLLVGAQFLKPTADSTFTVKLKGEIDSKVCGLKKHLEISTSQKIRLDF